MTTELTILDYSLFIKLAKAANDWNGQPLLDITKSEQGNLTHLKKLGLLTTFRDEGCDWADFTPEGKSLAQTLGIDI